MPEIDRDELARRAVHVSGTVVPAAYVADLVPWVAVGGVFAAGAAVAAALEALRLSGRVEWAIYDRLTREYERENPAGYALYMVGAAAVALALPPAAAVPALLMLTVADPLAGLLSAAGGPEGRKRAWVVAVTFLVCLGLAVPFLPPAAAVAAAAVATAADSLTPVVAGYVVDDNLSIPVGAGLAGSLVSTYAPAVPV